MPNPMSKIPYDIIVKNPVSTMTSKNLTDLFDKTHRAKRATTGSATLSTDQLLDMCPLSFVAKQDILAGCLTGIVYFCQGQKDFTQCHRYYDTVFSYSIFKRIGVCAAWKSGPRSEACKRAINGFSADLSYTTVNKDFASFFGNVLFSNMDYAPCDSQVEKCSW